jgi:hypothetical protein
VLHKPAVLRLEEPEGAANLLQFFLRCSEADKFLILYVFVKLGLLQVPPHPHHTASPPPCFTLPLTLLFHPCPLSLCLLRARA